VREEEKKQCHDKKAPAAERGLLFNAISLLQLDL
jgi:hypothetical protein